jgi:hypothetical protein
MDKMPLPKAGDVVIFPSGQVRKIHLVAGDVVDITPDKNEAPILVSDLVAAPGQQNAWMFIGNNPEAVARMRELWPMMVNLLTLPHVHESLRIQGQVVNWDAINDVERKCGLPETPCPDSDVTLRLGLENKERKKEQRS